MRAISMVCAVAILATAFFACAKKDDGSKDKKIGSLEQQLRQSKEHESTLQGELAQLNQRVTNLQNDFKIYSQKPCDFELDPIEYTLQKRPMEATMAPVMHSGSMASGMRPDMRPTPEDGTPAALKDLPSKARAARRGIKGCYQNALKKNASLQMGSRRVKLKFTVLTSGRMGRIMVVPPIGSGFEGCVRGLLRQWRFNKFKGSARKFSVAVNLRPQ
ncbi:MAG: hypothetical protein ABI333_07080 [bacterium]